jgi:hypothetical protein
MHIQEVVIPFECFNDFKKEELRCIDYEMKLLCN